MEDNQLVTGSYLKSTYGAITDKDNKVFTKSEITSLSLSGGGVV